MPDQNERMLRDLLATIHRDGGQYTEQHGLQKSVEDAIMIVSWNHLYAESFHTAINRGESLRRQDPNYNRFDGWD